MKLERVLRSLFLGSAVTLSSLIFGIYAQGEPLHEVRNGLPLPFLVQKIKIDTASLTELELKPLNLLVDLLFWALLLYLINIRREFKTSKFEGDRVRRNEVDDD